jgi:uncharacterized protein with FMN-binding domain
MKKVLILLAAMMVLVASSVSAATWADGVYDAWSDAGKNSICYAQVYIEGGKLVAVDLREFTNKLIEKDFAVYPWPQAKDANQTLGAKFVEAQGANVDIISGATGSSTSYIQAVERALLKADTSAKLPEYFDGVFFGRSTWTNHGYYEVARVTLKDGKVEDVSFQRIKADFSIQDPADYNWPLEAAWKSYASAAKKAEPGFVDALTGATGIKNTGNLAVRDALLRASTK